MTSPGANVDESEECTVCANVMILPFTIPGCRHKFCYTCVKAVKLLSMGGCPMCRHPIDNQAVEKPSILGVDLKMTLPESSSENGDQIFWLYAAKDRGWWRYDPRVEKYLEEACTKKLDYVEITICGSPYVVNLKNMIQCKKNGNPHLTRRVKRVTSHEFDQLRVKGIAGVLAR
ncbi:unnamed protein product [Caenorhabditis bovis]|uniref:E3 ubiquitin-protein ligase n=1 Tax=Caenorhabditis bovis TaxID=2654633 RepID=A0A8S1F3K1_9PELO|nr:unnamed protein product [Caenorhabditis bovis]